MVKVSVLCSTYNHKNFIRQALDSFLMQKTNFTFEVIIHDDASTDGTTEIIKEYAEKYPDIIKPIFQKENQYSKGIRGFTVRYLLPNAKGEYIALCEGDDYWTDENKLQIQADFLDNNPDYSLCFHLVRVFYENNDKEESIFPDLNEIKEFTTEQLLKGNFIQTNSVMYKRQKYQDLPTNIMPVDWYLHLYHAKFGKIGFIDKVMSAYRRHPGGIWWDSYHDMDQFFVKQGVNHINMYYELLKLFGGNTEYEELIWVHINFLLKNFIQVDRKKNEKLFEKSMEHTSNDLKEFLIYHGYIKLNEKFDQLNNMQHQLNVISNQLNDTYNSYTWRIGRMITFLPRIIMKFLNNLTTSRRIK